MPPPTLRVQNRNTCYRGSRRGSAALDAELDGVYGELVVVLVAFRVEVCLDDLGRLLAGDAGDAPDLESRRAGRYLEQVRHIPRGGCRPDPLPRVLHLAAGPLLQEPGQGDGPVIRVLQGGEAFNRQVRVANEDRALVRKPEPPHEQ